MTSLEEQMLDLRELPARVAGVELQILQLRDEMREAFSATRADFQGEIQRSRDELRTEMHGIRDELRDEIRAGNRESQDFMRTIYERFQADIRTMGEGRKRRTR